jgi:hypothetical protein
MLRNFFWKIFWKFLEFFLKMFWKFWKFLKFLEFWLEFFWNFLDFLHSIQPTEHPFYIYFLILQSTLKFILATIFSRIIMGRSQVNKEGSSLSTKSCSGVLNFGQAKMVLVNKNSSYVELSSPLLNLSGSDSAKCVFCPKTTAHEHDIMGKLKFDPKKKSYLISLLQKEKNNPKQSTNQTTASSLDIIPLKTSKSTLPLSKVDCSGKRLMVCWKI